MADKIADEAARWFADRDSGLLRDEAALAAWLAADPRHAAAFAEMESIWGDLGAVHSEGVVPGASDVGSPRRFRRVHAWPGLRVRTRWRPGAIAASLLAALLGWAADLPTLLRADAMTGTGERRTVTLVDGSHVVLNSDSAVAYDFRADRRSVRLLRGEAAFTVAPDRRRPFTVEAGGGTTTALGTRFLVREAGSETRVVVTEHKVRVTYGAPTLAKDLREGQGVTYGPGSGIGAVTSVDAADAQAWTEGLLVFEDRPLSEVVAELGRYHRGYVRLIGSDLQDRRVSGVFSTDDPLGAFARLEQSLGLRSIHLTDRLILIRE